MLTKPTEFSASLPYLARPQKFKLGDIIRSIVIEANPKLPGHKIDNLIDKYLPVARKATF